MAMVRVVIKVTEVLEFIIDEDFFDNPTDKDEAVALAKKRAEHAIVTGSHKFHRTRNPEYELVQIGH